MSWGEGEVISQDYRGYRIECTLTEDRVVVFDDDDEDIFPYEDIWSIYQAEKMIDTLLGGRERVVKWQVFTKRGSNIIWLTPKEVK